MYHDKVGIIYDHDDDFVVFHGSMNETPYALLPQYNSESIDVFPGWIDAFRSHYQPHIDAFESLWNGKTPHTVVIDLPDALKTDWYRKAPLQSNLVTPEGEQELGNIETTMSFDSHRAKTLPKVPTSWNGRPFHVRDHQKKALAAWQAYDFQSLFALATGAGKTVTAIYGAVRLFEQSKKLAMVIAVPYQALADQWVQELNRFQIYPHKCYESRSSWQDNFASSVRGFCDGTIPFVCAVVVNKTFKEENFQSILRDIPGHKLLFIGDECHHHGSNSFVAKLPTHARFRMGLSATPKHYCDEAANGRLNSFYGHCDHEDLTFSMTDALRTGTLTPYDYRVVPVSLTDDELDEYIALSKEIGKAMNYGGGSGDISAAAGHLMGQRARLLGLAENKCPTLLGLVRGRAPEQLTLFYVGEGDVTDSEGQSLRMVEQVSIELHQQGWNVARFTAQEGRREREDILQRFSNGLVDALVAMRCLDEGIDLPACGTAYILSSSRNPRQFIQRRGRVLRKAPGKEKATITDFVIMPPLNVEKDRPIQRSLVEKELKRVWEFARLSISPTDAVRSLLPYLDRYELHHMMVGDE
jgi:superfamily II DNA or RNA helicase